MTLRKINETNVRLLKRNHITPSKVGGIMRLRLLVIVLAVLTIILTGCAGSSYKLPPPTIGRIAFASDQGGNTDIYVMDADGSNLTRLTDNPTVDACPAWSPDGSRIAFMSDRDGNIEIYVMDADGSNLTRLTDNPASDMYPVWSPDGSSIALLSDRAELSSGQSAEVEVYKMDTNGNKQTRLTNNRQQDVNVAWSP
jgi:dipeptidyl aminopeptidase/acylaminoacyl peptidase